MARKRFVLLTAVCVFPPAAAGSRFFCPRCTSPAAAAALLGGAGRVGHPTGRWSCRPRGGERWGVDDSADRYVMLSISPRRAQGLEWGSAKLLGVTWEAKAGSGNFVLIHFVPQLSLHSIWV